MFFQFKFMNYFVEWFNLTIYIHDDNIVTNLIKILIPKGEVEARLLIVTIWRSETNEV